MCIFELNEEQVEEIEERLSAYDSMRTGELRAGGIRLGIEKDGVLIAGLDASLTAFHILYVSTVFVDEAYRRQGYGRALMLEMERRAKALGVDLIRLDTFDWQGKEFYLTLGYEIVGEYKNEKDGYAEFFFVKRI